MLNSSNQNYTNSVFTRMALLGDEYESSDEGSSEWPVKDGPKTFATPLVAAPEVSLDVWSYPS